MKKPKTFFLAALVHLLLLCSIVNQSALAQSDRSKAPPVAVEKWKDLRFGMFIHWGPVALTGYEIGWSRGAQTPIKEYDSLYLRFNPVLFDAEKWVQVAKAAGMKYIVLTTKHHDGFCLWPSKYTEYDISKTPFHRDIVGELAEACRKEGMGFGTYYSVCDWWHPYYPKGGRAGTEDKPNGNIDKYIEYLQKQTCELVENYGPLTCMWFDVPRLVDADHNEPTLKMLRALQPNLLINNRAYYDENVADFETPEQNLGTFNLKRPWETNMTIARQWAWKPNDEVKSLSQCLQGLIYTAGGDGNFLFNVGPNAMGEIEANQIKRLEEMGEWVNRYAEGIYGTRGGPIRPSGWGASTHKGNVIFLYVVRWQEGGKLRLPMAGNTILKVENLSGKEVHLKKGKSASFVSVPEDSRDEIVTVIRLTIDKPASDILPVEMGTVSGSLAYKKPSISSSIRWNQVEAQGPHQAFDDNPGSYWVPNGQESEWLEVDLEEVQTVNSVIIEQQQAHYKELLFQFEQNGAWETLFSETKWEGAKEISFLPIEARKFRIVITGGNTHLGEFQLFNSSTVSAQHVARNRQLLTSYRPMLPTDINQISYEDLDNDGDPDILKSKINGDIPVMWIDDDDDMREGDLEGDLDSDCMLVDRNKDGKYGHEMDFIVDFGDEDSDGDADIQVIADNVELNRTGWVFFPGHYMVVVDTDNDKVFNYINWNSVLIKCWDKNGHSHFFEDYLGQSLFLKMHAQTASIRDIRMNWENPFLFYDPDHDNISEYAVRVCDSPELLEKDVPHPEDGKIKDENRRFVFDGYIDRADIAFDLDNDNAPGNEFDFDMSLRFAGKGYSYMDQVHVFKSLNGLEGTDQYFYDKRWRNNEVLLYPDHETAYDLSFNKGEWDLCWFVFDEDDDCARWERVELYEPLNLFKIGQNNGGLDNNRQSDAAGDRGEFDQDNSGKGNLYIGKFDGRIHLHGAEWGAWRIDQEAKYYQGYGGIYNGTNLRDQKEPDKFATIKYEDTDANGFLDKIMYDLDGDTLFEKTVLLSELGINDECNVIETGKMEYADYLSLHKKATENMWEQAQLAIHVAKKNGLNTDWYSKLMTPNSLREKYHYAFWLNFYLHMDLLNLAMMKNEDSFMREIEKAYYSGDWGNLKHKSTDGIQFDSDGSVTHYDEFNTIIGEVGIRKVINPDNGNSHIIFSYDGKGVYGPRISLLEDERDLNQKDYNLVHLKFKIASENEVPLTWHIRFEKEGFSDVSTSIKLFDYISSDKDENGCYDCQIPLAYFQCPTKSITHAQLFCNDYGSRNNELKVDFDLHFLAFKKVNNIRMYYADFGVPKLDKNIKKRIAKIQESEFRGDETTSNGNNTRAGEGYSGEELFVLQKELRLLVHENLDEAPVERELEILELLRYGKPDREISYRDVQEKIGSNASKNNNEVELFYDGYAVYDYIRKYRATGDLRYFECAMVQADYVLTDPNNKKIEKERISYFANNNGTLGLGRGFSGICEAILEIRKTPGLHNKIAPSFYGINRTYLELADLWLPHIIDLIDEFNRISKYEKGRWTEGDGMSINRFLYYTHFLLAASESAKISGNPEYILWSQPTYQMVMEILQFFQGDCLLTNDRLVASKRVDMVWDSEKKVFTSEYGPYVIWAYAYPRSNTEDFAHIQMDIEAIDSILELDGSLLSEDFKKKMATMLFIATFNTTTGGMQRDICPDAPGLPPSQVKPWHTHFVHEYGRYIGKYCTDEAYDEFIRYQLLVWDQQLINGSLGRFSQYPMPREIVEARLFKYKPRAFFPRG